MKINCSTTFAKVNENADIAKLFCNLCQIIFFFRFNVVFLRKNWSFQTMKESLLSIITPVYNVEAYLDRCVHSVLSQSYRNIEMILIDDGSTDKSAALCDKWAQEDSRVIVIHKVNGGVSSARNVGLEVAKGEYLTFVDPDDFIAPETYSDNMAYLLEHYDVDILQYPYCNYYGEDEIREYLNPSAILLSSGEMIFGNWWSGAPLAYSVWNKIFKRILWDGVCFNVGHISEDTFLVPIFSTRANAVYISEKGMYYYQRNREQSYTYIFDFDKHLDMFYAYATIYECFNHYPKLVSEKVMAFTRLFRRLITAKQTNPSAEIQVPLNYIRKNFPTWREIFVSHNTEKLWLSLAKLLGTNYFIKFFLIYLRCFKC